MNIEMLIRRLEEIRKSLPRPELCTAMIDVGGILYLIDSVESHPGAQTALIKLKEEGTNGGPKDPRKRVISSRWEGLKCVITLECGCEVVRYQTHIRGGIPKKVLCKECQSV